MKSCIGLFQQKQFNLVKSAKQQISYFSKCHPSIRTLCKKLHDHKFCIFTPFIFNRNQQLFKIKQEEIIPIMPTIGLVFFLARECQHKISKIENTILHFPSSRYAFYKIETILKALNQLNLIPLKNIPNSRLYIFIKYYTS